MKSHIVEWFFVALGLAGIMLLIGWRLGQGNYLLGVLVDDRRRRVSLAKFQLFVWTVVIFSAFIVMMFESNSVNIYLSTEVWGLVGISVASVAGAAIVKGTKLETQPAPPPAVPVGGILPAPPPPRPFGVLAVSEAPHFTDIFKGDEESNKDVVDLAKVQMFFLTLIAVTGYITALLAAQEADLFPENKEYAAYFPALSGGLLTILGISHAGYLTVKAAPHTRTQ
jgi:hypothetical protein